MDIQRSNRIEISFILTQVTGTKICLSSTTMNRLQIIFETENFAKYEFRKGKCVQLIWGGCQANTINMFDTEEDCAAKCVNSQVIN